MRKRMSYSDADISIFANLIQANDISVSQVNDWAYAQYTNEGVEQWIEELALANDKQEVLETLRKNFNVSEKLGLEVLAGVAASDYFRNKVGLHETLSRLLFDIFIDSEMNEEKANLYLAEDFFGWHQQAESEALEVSKPILEKYAATYEESRKKFIA